MFNKRGQEGVTLGTLILIILGAVALVAIIMGFTGAWGFIFSKIGLLPGQTTQALAQSCEISAGATLVADFCGFKEVRIEGESDKRWVNCEYGPINAILKEKLGSECSSYKSGEVAIYSEETKCAQLVQSKKLRVGPSVMINDKKCTALEPTDGPGYELE